VVRLIVYFQWYGVVVPPLSGRCSADGGDLRAARGACSDKWWLRPITGRVITPTNRAISASR
jgi:hypothetical protein